MIIIIIVIVIIIISIIVIFSRRCAAKYALDRVAIERESTTSRLLTPFLSWRSLSVVRVVAARIFTDAHEHNLTVIN